MKIAEINMTHLGSTGKIMFQIANVAQSAGYTVRTFSPYPFSRSKKQNLSFPENHFVFGTYAENGFHYYAGELLGRNGYFSRRGTGQLINELEMFKPDLIHLHNLHNFSINLPMLFDYIKTNNISVVWTLHDCWAFTGHCPYFSIVNCEKWKTGCNHCQQPDVYPKMYIDTSKVMFEVKKEWFSNISNITLVTPSRWLANLVNESFLKQYPVEIINNGIDLSVFKPQECDFRTKYSIKDEQCVILGVAFGWGYRKGLDVFIRLANLLDSKYQIVLVGTDDRCDKQLPSNIISIHRTNNQNELAKIYSSADIFLNPTREENFPTVNLESLACGTPVITFNTGGSPEMLNNNCGVVVEQDDISSLVNNIEKLGRKNQKIVNYCLEQASHYSQYDKFVDYIDLYQRIGELYERN